MGLGTGEPCLGSLNEEIALELSDGFDDVHGHLSGGAGEIDAAQCQAMDADTLSSSLATVVLTSTASRPNRSSLVTTSTSPVSILSTRRAKPSRCAIAAHAPMAYVFPPG